MFFDVGKLKVMPAGKKHAYAVTVLTRRFFPYVNFSFETVLQRLADERITYVVAEYDGHTVGFADVEFMPEREAERNMRVAGAPESASQSTVAKILGLAVLPEFQGQGVGKKLFNKILSMSRKKAVKAMILVAEDNGRAQKLYAQHGFTRKGLLDRQLGGKSIIVLEKSL